MHRCLPNPWSVKPSNQDKRKAVLADTGQHLGESRGGNKPHTKKAKLETQLVLGLVVATIPSGNLASETKAGSVQRDGLNIHAVGFVPGKVETTVDEVGQGYHATSMKKIIGMNNMTITMSITEMMKKRSLGSIIFVIA